MTVEEFYNRCHGSDGRFCGAGTPGTAGAVRSMLRSDPHKLAATVMSITLKNEGATVDPHTGKQVRTGYSVGVRPKLSKRVSMKGASTEQVVAWLKEHQAELSKPGHNIGSWHDQQTGLLWLDVVRVYPNDARGRAKALAAAGRHQQISIYHLDKDDVIDKRNANELRRKFATETP